MMHQPCIVDLKMGKQTWDPVATEEKQRKEDSKYVECKTKLGFCIPGLHTHHISSGGELRKYGRDYGKKLNERTAIDGECWLGLKRKWNLWTNICKVNFQIQYNISFPFFCSLPSHFSTENFPQYWFRLLSSSNHTDSSEIVGHSEMDESPKEIQILLELDPHCLRLSCAEAILGAKEAVSSGELWSVGEGKRGCFDLQSTAHSYLSSNPKISFIIKWL